MAELKSPFEVASNKQAFMKVGMYGFGKSGKTYTASQIAIGIYNLIKEKKPVAFMDTETGSDYVVEMFRAAGVPLLQTKSRSFLTLMDGIKWAEKNCSVLIIDSITHFWRDAQDSYKKAKVMNLLRKKGVSDKDIEAGFASGKFQPASRLTFADWGPLKDEWAQFTDLYLNSKLHVIISGRAGYEYDFTEDEDGNKQIEKTGSKMKAETEMSFEPSLLLEMRREKRDTADGRVDARFWDHVCYVLGDRTNVIDSQRFVNPTFNDFMPVWKLLNIGGDHVGVTVDGDSSKLFTNNSEAGVGQTKRKIEIILEEIEGDLTSSFPGRSSADQAIKADLLLGAFGTRSWTAISGMDLPRLTQCRQDLQRLIEVQKSKPPVKGEK